MVARYTPHCVVGFVVFRECIQGSFVRNSDVQLREHDLKQTIYGGFPKLGVPFWVFMIRNSSILGAMLGVPPFGTLP